MAFAPPPVFREAGDAEELRVNAPPALVVVVVVATFVVDVDDVLARAFDGDEDDDEFGDDDTSIDAAGDAPVFNPRVFSFQVSLLLSVLLDENSVERRRLVNVFQLNYSKNYLIMRLLLILCEISRKIVCYTSFESINIIV